MKITLVKKILSDGSPCKKCGDVIDKLEASGNMARIDEIVIADERDSNSPGLVLAREHNVDRAPFFIVEQSGQPAQIFTVYLKFVKEVLDQEQSAQDQAREILENSADLDFI